MVDYADRWPASALLALLTKLRDLHAQVGVRVRVLLLARSDGYWWPAVADRADSDLGIEAGGMRLPPLADDSVDDRANLFTAAAGRFAAAQGLATPQAGWPVPDLDADGFGQVLAVHMGSSKLGGLRCPRWRRVVAVRVRRRWFSGFRKP